MTTVNSPSTFNRRYMLVCVDLPQGGDMVSLANKVSKYIREDCNLNNSTPLIKSSVGEVVHKEALEAFESGTLGPDEIYIHQALSQNIQNLVIKCRNMTWFNELDSAIRHYQSVENFCKPGKPPTFSMYHEGNSYYLQHAFMKTIPFTQNGKTITAQIDGKDYVLYEYTFKFNPAKDSITLDSLFEDRNTVINWLKNHYINQAGWGLPALGIVQTNEENKYNINNVRMGIDGNNVYVLAPHIEEFNELTTQPVLDIKAQWLHSVPSSLPQHQGAKTYS